MLTSVAFGAHGRGMGTRSSGLSLHSVLCSLALLAWGAPSGVALAAVHVEVAGNDSTGDGSPGNPWATIGHALTQVGDGDTILVGAGEYTGRVSLTGRFASGVTVRAEPRYGARLVATTQQAMICFACEGITIEGFEVTHPGPGAGGLVVQVQDAAPADGLPVGRLVFRDNVFHDSFNNDIVKVNNAATDVLISGNMFYNQAGSDEHLDINSVTGVTIEDNVFFNDFAGSGRSDSDTSSFIVIKDSNGASDGVVGASNVTVRRNVFLHWEGSSGQGFVRVGEDGTATFEADGVLIENNLMLGNNSAQIRSPLQFQGVRNVTARANTIAGNMPAKEFGFRLVTVGANQPSENIGLFNNIWSDPSGTMGDVFNRGSATTSLTVDNNLYWNDGNAFPTSAESVFEVVDDAGRVEGDPVLADNAAAVLPRFLPGSLTFADGSTTIREVFENLVALYGVPGAGSAALDAADPAEMPADDILGEDRSAGGAPDIGALEVASCATALDGTPCDDGNPCTAPDACAGGVCVGTNDDGAACDDGNACTAPDLCAGGVCTGTPDDGASCDDGDACSRPDTCIAGICVSAPAPREDCSMSTKASLRLRESDRPGKDLLQWKWDGGPVAVADFGDPAGAGTDFNFCIFDTSSGVPSTIFAGTLPGAASCDGRPCWKATGTRGFRYKSASGAPEGIRQLKLKAAAKASIGLKAGRDALVLPVLPLEQSPSVSVQLSIEEGSCWQTLLDLPADRNTTTDFRAKH